jgi:hypothetical protein
MRDNQKDIFFLAKVYKIHGHSMLSWSEEIFWIDVNLIWDFKERRNNRKIRRDDLNEKYQWRKI